MQAFFSKKHGVLSLALIASIQYEIMTFLDVQGSQYVEHTQWELKIRFELLITDAHFGIAFQSELFCISNDKMFSGFGI